MRRDKDKDATPPAPEDQHELWIAMAIVVLLLLTVWLAGCATTDCCATCPERIQLVPQPPEIITVLPPVVQVPEVPALESSVAARSVPFDPATWMRAVVGDVARLLATLEQARAELIAINASRPTEEQPR